MGPCDYANPLLLLVILNRFYHALIVVWSCDKQTWWSRTIFSYEDFECGLSLELEEGDYGTWSCEVSLYPRGHIWPSDYKKGLNDKFLPYTEGWAVCFRRRERIRLGGEKALWYCPLDNNDSNDDNDNSNDDSYNNEAVEQLASWDSPTAGTSLV